MRGMVGDTRSDATGAPSAAWMRAGTVGFLFADIRGYTQFADTHGDHAAADLLRAYRELVRAAVARHEGAEIRTEGDSFYVIFPSASSAVRCGLEVVDLAAEVHAGPDGGPLTVGIGVHAGEAVATDEGHVGTAVNTAARVCSKASANEVWVTDTVRSLTRTVLDVSFVPRGSHHLKGLAEPVQLYRAVPGSVGHPMSDHARTIHQRRLLIAGLTVIAALVLGTAAIVARPGGGSPRPIVRDAMPAGAYTTTRFQPTTTFRVPEGWYGGEEYPDEFILTKDRGIGGAIIVDRPIAVWDGACKDRAAVAVPRDPLAFMTWLKSHRSLAVAGEKPILFDGGSGLLADVAVTGGVQCDGTGPVTELYPMSVLGNSAILRDGERTRIAAISVGDDVVLIWLQGPLPKFGQPTDVEPVGVALQEVVNTFAFPP